MDPASEPAEVVEIDAVQKTGQRVRRERDAAELAGCSHHTVGHYVAARDEGRLPGEAPTRRAGVIDPSLAKLEELVDRSHGKVRADVAHEKITAMGYAGSKRTTRRAVAQMKAAGRRGGGAAGPPGRLGRPTARTTNDSVTSCSFCDDLPASARRNVAAESPSRRGRTQLAPLRDRPARPKARPRPARPAPPRPNC
jgi:hypothetical protein